MGAPHNPITGKKRDGGGVPCLFATCPRYHVPPSGPKRNACVPRGMKKGEQCRGANSRGAKDQGYANKDRKEQV